jgi:hypothetical protein
VHINYELSERHRLQYTLLEVKEPNYQLARNNRENSTDRVVLKRVPGVNITGSIFLKSKNKNILFLQGATQTF